MRFLALLKFILVLGLLAVGALFLLKGLGFDVPTLKFEGLEARDTPAGIALLIIGVALARFWKIRHTTTITKTRVTESPHDERVITTKSKMRQDVQFMPEISDPPDDRLQK